MLDTAAAGLVLTGEDKEIVDMVHDFVLKEVRPKAAEHDISGELDWDAYNKAFEMGLVCADLPAESFAGPPRKIPKTDDANSVM